MKTFLSLSSFPIRVKIFLGFIPVLIVLGVFAYSSYVNFINISNNFESLSESTNEEIAFLEIEKDVVELQRNVLVYSYVGYKGVLRKIKFLQNELEQKFDAIRPYVEQDEEIKDRFERMFEHYKNYKEAFEEAVKKKASLKELGKNKLDPLIKKNHGAIRLVSNNLKNNEHYKLAYILSVIERDLMQADINIKSFEINPDAKLINNTNQLISQIRENIIQIKDKITEKKVQASIVEFLDSLNQYQDIFVEIITINRVYLQLVNVVLAGKAAEIDSLSQELDTLISKRSQDLNENIIRNIKDSQKQYLLFSTAAIFISIFSVLLIAKGISKPVRVMASTLSQLSKGKSDTEIPGQKRKDEVGEMARAANEFKTMAANLVKQGHALENANSELEEFAYRTSHDLRSPLVSSIGLLDIAKNCIQSNKNERALESIAHIQKSLKTLETLVKDILSLTQAKNSEENSQFIDIDCLIDETLDKFKYMDNFERLDIQKQFNFKGELKTKKSRFILVLENLISNAIKYQDIEKENSRIKILTDSKNGNLILEVHDNGLGIPKNQQGKLFTMFKRFHPKVSFGSGLGLYMMKKSVDILNGNIYFEDPGDGAIFKLEIPLS